MSHRFKPSWMDSAACQDSAVSKLFFEETRPTVVRAAKKICMSCPVNSTCLAYALENREVGIWGGTTTNQRAVMLRLRGVEIVHTC